MSIEGLLALLVLLALLLAGIGWYAWQLRRSLRQLEDALHRAEAAGREQAARIASLEQLRDSQQLAEHVVETGTSLVREVHKGIAGIPFGILEAIPGAREPARAVRGLHDAISEGVYGALSGLNRAVGRELRKGLELQAGGAVTPSPTPAEEPIPPAAEARGPEAEEPPQEGPQPDKPWKNWG